MCPFIVSITHSFLQSFNPYQPITIIVFYSLEQKSIRQYYCYPMKKCLRASLEQKKELVSMIPSRPSRLLPFLKLYIPFVLVRV